jgi:hypothetical protein
MQPFLENAYSPEKEVDAWWKKPEASIARKQHANLWLNQLKGKLKCSRAKRGGDPIQGEVVYGTHET